MNDNGKRKKQFQWLCGVLAVLFSVVGGVANAELSHTGHETNLVGGMPMLAMSAARWVATWIFRRRGLSRETHFEMVWPNTRTAKDAPAAPHVLRFPNSLRWTLLSVCGLLLALIGLVYFGLPADERAARADMPPVAAVIAAVGLGSFALFSRPAMRLDAWGIRAMGGRKVAWNAVRACRVEIKRNVVGEVFSISVHALGAGNGQSQRRLAAFSLSGYERAPELSLSEHDRAAQQQFLLALHHALQPDQDAPDIAQVLAAHAEDA